MLDLGHIGAGAVFAARYRVHRLLKAGGMGAVYVAEHTTTKKRVALKLMRPEIVADESARARFVQEAQASALVESSNVVDVYDAGVDTETNIPFIVMELLVGKELGELVNERGRLSPGEVVDCITQTSRALDKAHAAGIIHRDLKPDNLFLAVREGEPSRVKILDFGIAKFLASTGAEATRASGTPLYMAPEQTRRGANVGPQTDIWALGLIAYTLLVGRPYWEGEDIHELFGEILGGEHESPVARAARFGVTLPATFDGWFFRCVAINAAARFARAGEAASALAEAFGLQAQAVMSASQPRLGDRESDAILSPRHVISVQSPLRPMSSLEDAATMAELPTASASHFGSIPAAARPSGPAPATPSQTGNTVVPVGATRAEPPRVRGVFAIGAAAIAVFGGGMAFMEYRATTRAPAGGSGSDSAPDASNVHGAASGSTKIDAPARKPAVSLALGLADATCGLDGDGAVRCSGASFLQEEVATTPKPFALPGPATAIALGKHHACARLIDTTIACWGHNETGQLGDGTETMHGPLVVPSVRNVEQIALSIHGGCVRQAGGRVKCWGGNKYGQVGDGTTTPRLAPVEIDAAQGAIAIALGQDHACAVFGDGTVRCWGKGAEGQLGLKDRANRATPTRVEGVSGAIGVALGGYFSCAMLRDGSVRCWGSNGDGELGDGTTATSRSTALPVAGLQNVRQLSAGWKHACARFRETGEVRCWGQNTFGQLGDGTTTNRATPVLVKGKFSQVVTGRMHTCGVLMDDEGTVCWGRNEEGQLGDGSTTNRLAPVRVTW